MKANQKFMKNDDEAVSPVIAVILMVAITVVLAATVYVWVSGFGSSANNTQQHTLSMASASAISEATDVFSKRYTVSSADPSLTYGDMRLAIDGTQYTFDATGCTLGLASSGADDANVWSACAGSTARTANDLVKAGDTILISCYSAGASGSGCLGDKVMVITDIEANSVMVTLAVR